MSALPLAVQAQFNEYLTGLAMLCREHQLDATQVGQAVTMAVTKRLSSRLCEDCDLKQPSFGMVDERKRRWCSGCAKAHVGAVHLRPDRKCEDCGLKVPWFGMEAEPTKHRWCSRCAKAHAGAVNLALSRMRKRTKTGCEDCGVKARKFGMESEQTKRWCSGCATAHAGAVNLSTKNQCENCGLKAPRNDPARVRVRVLRARSPEGLESERKVRWCGPCAKAHGGVNYRASTANSTTARTARRKRAVGRASTAGATKRGRGQNSYSEKGRTEA